LERYAIAQNLSTPQHIHEKLTHDVNSIVRAAASAISAALVHASSFAFTWAPVDNVGIIS
jgi:hypothetical protein